MSACSVPGKAASVQIRFPRPLGQLEKRVLEPEFGQKRHVFLESTGTEKAPFGMLPLASVPEKAASVDAPV
jgi:hypothetical protein